MNADCTSGESPWRFDQASPMPRGTETILVMDDEPLVLKISVHELKKLGYSVIPAHSGEEAIAYLSQHEVDLLVMDLIMPGMDGLESFRRIKSLKPQLKAMVYTGYAPPATISEIEALGAGPFLLKPTPLPVLAQAIRARLDSP